MRRSLSVNRSAALYHRLVQPDLSKAFRLTVEYGVAPGSILDIYVIGIFCGYMDTNESKLSFVFTMFFFIAILFPPKN
jgi:hypothetical protein